MTEETKKAIRECAEIADTFSDCDGPPSREFKRLWPEAFATDDAAAQIASCDRVKSRLDDAQVSLGKAVEITRELLAMFDPCSETVAVRPSMLTKL